MEEYSAGPCIRASRGGGGAGTKCGRWNPTSEQVKVLTELFRSGLRTPSTDQIQKISSELSFYGKIESKNVFYWFQNHKARERLQKRRRVLADECNHMITTTKVSSTKSSNLGDDDEMIITEHERVIETQTLQLFPLNSFSTQAADHHSDKLRLFRDDCKENATSFTYDIGKEIDHSTLDLRLSFV